MWEYTVRALRGSNLNVQNELNVMGIDRWELVSVLDINYNDGEGDYLRCIFKRLKEPILSELNYKFGDIGNR